MAYAVNICVSFSAAARRTHYSEQNRSFAAKAVTRAASASPHFIVLANMETP
jgi:hypothetical protein